ncbi:MAG: AMMECR1 domain-containing protein, partial [Chloroflexi bacterium]|nr:AMMECR1 domain-containing protein [Chloroflexota bacterium]
MTLTPQEKQTLLALAREAITRIVRRQKPPLLDLKALSENLRGDGACFVTLTKHGALRGCIGS